MYDDDDEYEVVGGAPAKASPQSWAKAGNPMPPWHMWGNTVRLDGSVRTAAGGQQVGRATSQLLRVSYKRPETWSFFLGARIVNASASTTGCTIRVVTDVMLGVGRSMYDTTRPDQTAIVQSGFSTFVWVVPPGPGTNLLLLPPKYTTVASRVVLDDSVPAAFERCEWFPATDIQMTSKLILTTTDQDLDVSVEVTGFVAPRTHVRPDWFNASNRFLGGETGGT